MELTAVLPHVNAALNATSTVLLIIAYALIRSGRREAHRRVMIVALIVSAIFLVCYLTYHFTAAHRSSDAVVSPESSTSGTTSESGALADDIRWAAN